MPKSLRRIVLVLVPLILIAFVAATRLGIVPPGVAPTGVMVELIAGALSANLPRRIDRYLVWESVEAEGTRAVFTYRIDLTSHGSSTRHFLTDMQAKIPALVCDRLALRSLVWMGGVLSFKFYDGRNNMLRQIDFDPAACAS